MMVTASLFFGGEPVGTAEAPRRVLKEALFDLGIYHAVLKKRFSRITADDFLKYARRFSVLCNEVYRDSKLELLINEEIPLGSAVFAESLGVWEGAPGEKLNIDQLTVNEFRNIFDRSLSISLVIRPLVERYDIRYSFSRIDWIRGRPRTIFFYSQGESLHNLLIRKMFYVSGVAPSLNFTVKLGVKAELDEAIG